jgi:hypothetical protein
MILRWLLRGMAVDDVKGEMCEMCKTVSHWHVHRATHLGKVPAIFAVAGFRL